MLPFINAILHQLLPSDCEHSVYCFSVRVQLMNSEEYVVVEVQGLKVFSEYNCIFNLLTYVRCILSSPMIRCLFLP